jgi:type IV pilus modification protein PilV
MSISSANRQRGMSLIEAMIALLVLTIGLVGLGALMLTSMKNVHSSAHYSVASAIILDLEELLWLEMSQTVASTSTTPTKNVTDLDGGCLSDTVIDALAAAVQAEWRTESAAGNVAWSDADRFKLPGISITVGDTVVAGYDKDGDGNDDVSWKQSPVTLSWDEGRFSEDSTTESYTANIMLPCRPVFL